MWIRKSYHTWLTSLGASVVCVLATLAWGGLVSAAEPIKVRMGWQPAEEALFFIAREDKLFEKVGLAPEYIRFNAGPPMFAALRAGDVDIAYMGTPPAVIAMAQGIPIKIFYVEANSGPAEALIVQPDSGINKVADLKGKTVAIWRGTSADYALQRALTKAGLKEGDLKILDLDVTAIIAAFRKKEVDGVVIWDPWALQLENMGGKSVIRASDVGVQLPVSWLGQDAWLANPEGAKRFIQAMKMAHKIMTKDLQRVAAVMAKVMEMKAEDAEKVINRNYFPTAEELIDPGNILSMHPDAIAKGKGLVDVVKGVAEFLKSKGRFKKIPDVANRIDPRGLKLALGQ